MLSNSDQPGSQLVATRLDGSNFLSWSRNVRLALGAKIKLGFIDGSCRRPTLGTPDCARWVRADHMVRCWLLNSMEGKISELFIYVDSTFQLWQELVGRFGQTNGPLLFQLKRSLASLEQGSLSVGEYYSKIKKLWDEIRVIRDIVECDCGVLSRCACEYVKRVKDQENNEKLIEFLMGLSEEFDVVQSNLLSMDPLPSMNRAFYLVQQVERQKIVSGSKVEMNALSVNSFSKRQQQQHGRMFYYNNRDMATREGYLNRKGNFDGKNDRDKYDRDGRNDRFDRRCDFCGMKGHIKDKCYKLIGYPENWKFKSGDRRANVVGTEAEADNPLSDNMNDRNDSGLDPALVNMMR